MVRNSKSSFHDVGEVLDTHILPLIRSSQHFARYGPSKQDKFKGKTILHLPLGVAKAADLQIACQKVFRRINNLQARGRYLDAGVNALTYRSLLQQSRYLFSPWKLQDYGWRDYRNTNDVVRTNFYVQLATFAVTKRAFTHEHFDKLHNRPKSADITGARWYASLGNTLIVLRQKERMLLHETIAAEYEMQAQIEHARQDADCTQDLGEQSLKQSKRHSRIVEKLRLSPEQYRQHRMMIINHDLSMIDLITRFQSMKFDDHQDALKSASYKAATLPLSLKQMNWGFKNMISFHNVCGTGYYWVGCREMLNNCGGPPILRHLPLLAQTTVNPPDEIEYCGLDCNCIVF